jgi:protein-disulfide isomerase
MRLFGNLWFQVFLAMAVVAGGVTVYNQWGSSAYTDTAGGGSAQPPAAQTTRAMLPTARKIVMPYNPNWPSIGRTDAPLVMVEFEDYECPFSRRFKSQTFDKLSDKIADGSLRFIARDLPLQMHPYALKAAVAARCAGQQNKPPDKYWEVREALYAEPDLNDDVITRIARQHGLEMSAFGRCQKDQVAETNIVDEAARMNKLGIVGTPTFVLGRVKNNLIEGVTMIGALPYSDFETRIREVQANP